MKSTKSSKQTTGTYAFTSIFRYDLRRFWAVPALFLLSLLVSCPIACLLVTEPGKDRAEFLSTMIGNQYPLTTFLCCTMAMAMGIGVFEYIQKPRVANYTHSFPVRRRELFAANYITGTIMLFIPIAVTALIMIPFAVANSGGIVEVEPAGLLVWMLMSWLLSAVIFSITVFAGMVSGTVFMHLFNSLFFCFVVVMLIAVVDQYASMMLYGYTQSEAIGKLILNSMPFVALFGTPRVPLIVTYIIIWIALSLLTACIYGRRAIENTGNSLVFTWTKSLIIGVVSFIGTCYMGVIFRELSSIEPARINVGLLIGMAFGFAATFLVISLIVYKGPKIFGKQNLLTAGIVILVTILFTGSLALDVTGYEKNNFKADSTTAVAARDLIQGYGSRLNSDAFKSNNRFDVTGEYGGSTIGLVDPENIDAVCRIQNTLAASGGVNGVRLYDGEEPLTISLEAKTDSGKILSRSYDDVDDRKYTLIEKDVAKVFESTELKKIYAFSNLRYGIGNIYVHRSDDNSYEKDGDVAKDKVDGLIKAMDLDFAGMTYDQVKSAYELSQSDRPEEVYYEVTLTLEDTDETLIDTMVTKDQKNAWKWIRENIDK